MSLGGGFDAFGTPSIKKIYLTKPRPGPGDQDGENYEAQDKEWHSAVFDQRNRISKTKIFFFSFSYFLPCKLSLQGMGRGTRCNAHQEKAGVAAHYIYQTNFPWIFSNRHCQLMSGKKKTRQTHCCPPRSSNFDFIFWT